MDAIRVVGLDASLTATGLARPDGTCCTIRPRAKPGDRGRRLYEIVTRVDAHLKACKPVDLVVIESYFVHRALSKATCLRLGELGGVLRERLFEMEIPYVEVHPSRVKKYATGDHQAGKDEMVAAAVGCGVPVADDNQADAFFMHAMGRSQFSDTWEPAFRSVELLEARAGVRRSIRWPALEGATSG